MRSESLSESINSTKEKSTVDVDATEDSNVREPLCEYIREIFDTAITEGEYTTKDECAKWMADKLQEKFYIRERDEFPDERCG